MNSAISDALPEPPRLHDGVVVLPSSKELNSPPDVLPPIPMPYISPEEALSLIGKWQQEGRIVQANFVDAENSKEFSCALVGLIQEAVPSEVRIDTGIQLRRGDLPGCVLRLHGARFELLDSRNVPAGEKALKLAIEQAYEYVLVIHFGSGAVCELYVFKEGTQETDIFRG